MTFKYPRSASNARAGLPVAAQTDSGMMETMTTSERTSSK